ncbi:MAG: Holliday junction resolvase RuvX [Gudongella sp.]|jgi:putative Holliday junction resolvase|nr:Holliday junction resolvase RuvX [Gudongella sp.]
MERILGLDVGTKRIGVAISDALGITAQPLTVITRESKKKDLAEIEALLSEYSVKKVVVGMPYNMNGTVGPSGEMARTVAEKIKNKFGVEIVYIDERLSTVSAERVLIESEVRRENRKNMIDKVAASYILQTYLDSK